MVVDGMAQTVFEAEGMRMANVRRAAM